MRPIACLICLVAMACSFLPAATLRSRSDLSARRVITAITGVAVDSSGFVYLVGTTASPEFPVTAGPLSRFNGSGGFSSVGGDVFVRKLSPDLQRVIYSILLGGSSDETSAGIVVDEQGNVFITGYTNSTDFPVTAPSQPARQLTPQTPDAFVCKVNASGSALVYSRLIGGANADRGTAIALTPGGRAVVVGNTASTDFPTTDNALQRALIYAGTPLSSSPSAFVIRFDGDGNIDYATYLGGTGGATATGVAADRAGNIYVTGLAGPNFPTLAGAFATHAVQGGFLSKIDEESGQFVYSTYIPGVSFADIGAYSVLRIYVDERGHTYLAGPATAGFRTTVGAFQTDVQSDPYLRYAGRDAFLMELDSTGRELVFSTLIGGTGDDLPLDVVRTGTTITIAGITSSHQFPVNEHGLPVCSLASMSYVAYSPFLARFDHTGRRVDSFRYLGCEDERVTALALAPQGPGSVLLAGTYQERTATFLAHIDLETVSPVQIAEVADSASQQIGPLAPLELITVYGKGLGPPQGVSGLADGLYRTEVAGTTVYVSGMPAALLYVRDDQVNAVMPGAIPYRWATVTVTRNSIRSSEFHALLERSTPALFTLNARGSGPGAILNQDGTVNSAANPATRGSIVSVWGTGGGQTQPLFPAGEVVPAAAPLALAAAAWASIGEVRATVLYAGAAPGLVNGVMQVNLRVPDDAPTGPAVPLVMGIYPFRSQAGVTIAVR